MLRGFLVSVQTLQGVNKMNTKNRFQGGKGEKLIKKRKPRAEKRKKMTNTEMNVKERVSIN